MPLLNAQLFEPDATTRATVLAIHGFGGSTEQSWVKPGWIKKLNAAGFAVYAVPLPLHTANAGSQVSDDSLQKAFIGQLSAQIPQLSPPVMGLGFSFGARVIWELLATPDQQLTSAVLIGLGATNHMDAAAHEIATGQASAHHPARLFDRVLAHTAVPQDNLLRFAQLTADNFEPGNDTINAPVLLISGEFDELAQDTDELVTAITASHQICEKLAVPGRDHISVLTSGLARSTAVKFFTRHTG